jgi:Coenzyme PQQ synthesis protein D (PqqD)
MDSVRFRASAAVRASVSPDGLVLLDVSGGLVLASNPVGARIWELIGQRCTRPEIARQLAADYEISLERAHRDVDAFAAALLARGLVAPEPSC